MAHVLLVDDERSIRVTLGEFLRGDGHQVRLAADAETAQQILREEDLDVIVTDIILPRISGVALLQIIRKTSPHVQVILVTGEPTLETVTAGLRAGAVDYLLKPVSKEMILKTVANAAKIKALGDAKRRLEEENRAYQDGLELLVEERTKELRESEERYRTLVENIDVGVYRMTADAPGRFLHVNAALARLLGYDSAAELAGVPARDLSHNPEERPALVEALRRQGALKGHELRLRKKDGTLIWASCTATAQFGDYGRIKWIDGIVEDITERKLAEQRLTSHLDQLRKQLARRYNMVGESEPMRELFQLILKVAPTDAGVLICGESGTGKELVARALHEHSCRSAGNLEVVNCAAVPPALLESELFGHVRGAFTGAIADKPGRFELADEGTLFLDEVCEMSLECQAKLLRAIEEQTVRRVGDTRELAVDVRIIAATNRDPNEAIEEGRLRADLFYRLDRFRLTVPPLRERRGDVAMLARHFLGQFEASLRRQVTDFAPEVLHVLQEYEWPGNVRELRNIVEQMVILAERPFLRLDDVPIHIREAVRSGKGLVEPLSDVERRHVLRVLQAAGGNIRRTARMLGIDRSTLYARLKKYGVRS